MSNKNPIQMNGTDLRKPCLAFLAMALLLCRPASFAQDLGSEEGEKEIYSLSVFAEPLVPVGGITDPGENAELMQVLEQFRKRPMQEDVHLIQGFLQSHPDTRWHASLSANLGALYYRTGYFSKALSEWEEAWALAKSQPGSYAASVGDYAVGELARMNARLGRFDRLEKLFREISGRDIRGPATEKITGAREGYWLMQNRPEEAFRCGPMALKKICDKTGLASKTVVDLVTQSRSTPKGISLDNVALLSGRLGLRYQMAFRSIGSRVVFPAVVHWKVGHYSSITGFANGLYHIEDPTFHDDLWLTKAALDAEASGYFLIPKGDLPPNWRAVPATEGAKVWGKGNTGQNDDHATGAGDDKSGGDGCPGRGMPHYAFHTMLVSLNIVDAPLGYRPPVGPDVSFRVTYNQREAYQPALFNYSNLGSKWTFDWMSYVTDDPTNPSAEADVYLQGSGTEAHTVFTAATNTYEADYQHQAVLVRTSASPITYERRLPDGSKQVFGASNGATASPRKVFMTKLYDAAGNALTFAYDASHRLTTVTDAIGQTSTLTYSLSADPLKITKVTDPFGRTALIGYNSSGQLNSLTDEIGMSSSFAYATGDFISSMTTPYGTTRFASTEGTPAFLTDESSTSRRLDATDPMGQKERLEYRHNVSGIGSEASVPVGMDINNQDAFLTSRNSYYWNKKNQGDNLGDYSKARISHWMHAIDNNVTSPVESSHRDPLEGRIWYDYAGQWSPEYMVAGMIGKPSVIGRVLDDGTTQIYKYEYNALGKTTKATDPLGRVTTYAYAANNIDLLTVQQLNGAAQNLLYTATYNSLHQPLTVKSAAGQTTTYTYNAKGQVLTIKNPKNETTTFTYNAAGYLTKITGAQATDSTVYTYDGLGRVATLKRNDGYKLTYAYDNLDRITQITYPDLTTEAFTYNRLDLEQTKDRLGRMTRTFFNSVRQPVAFQDALGRTTNMDWCGCGSIGTVTDPAGRTTTWTRDGSGRLLEKAYADGKKTTYAYEPLSGRLKTVTDPKGQKTNYAYFPDNAVKQISYTGAVIATPSVSFTYDPAFPRLSSMTDGTGLTKYAYNAIAAAPALGAGSLASIDGPFANDVIAYQYDALDRVTTQTVNGVNETYAYDNLGRMTAKTNALGAFTFKYVSVTDRLDSLIYPNGQKNRYGYSANTGDFRLQQIKDLNPALASLSQFDYTYDAVGQILTWSQKAGAANASVHNFSYDAANQLLGDEVKSSATGNPILKHDAYEYDLSGNRTSVQETGILNAYAYNAVNQLTSQSPGGKLRVLGGLNEAGTVTLNSVPVPVSSANKFDGKVQVATGTALLTVTAKDYSNNSRTSKYNVTTSGTSATYAYDANGNLTGDGTSTYEWDAADRLVAINKGTARTEFTYDGESRRVRIVEKTGTTVNSDMRFLWAGNQILEQRDATGGTTAKKYFDQGVLVGTTKYFYTRDHLGSIREMTDNTGAIVAQYEYSPYGVRTRVAGTLNADFGFTGHYVHAGSGLYLAKYRAYSAVLGRWMSRDPIEERGGINLYGYVKNKPISDVDSLGLFNVATGIAGAAAAGYDGWSTAGSYGGSTSQKAFAAAFSAAMGFGISGFTWGYGMSGAFGAATSAATDAFSQWMICGSVDPNNVSDAARRGLAGGVVGSAVGSAMASEFFGAGVGAAAAGAGGLAGAAAANAMGGPNGCPCHSK